MFLFSCLQFILKAWKSFQRCVDTIIEKNGGYIFNKFTVLYPSSYFVVDFLKFKLILFYNRIVYYNTRIFLILLPCTVLTLLYLLFSSVLKYY